MATKKPTTTTTTIIDICKMNKTIKQTNQKLLAQIFSNVAISNYSVLSLINSLCTAVPLSKLITLNSPN